MGVPMARSAAVSALGWVNIVYGLLWVALGGYIIFAGADAARVIMQAGAEAKEANKQGAGQAGATSEDVQKANQAIDAGATGFAGIFMAMAGVLGFCAIVSGLPAILVGWGVLARRQWARILTLIFAVLAILAGLGGLANYSGGAAPIVSGLLHLAYGIFAFVVLLNKQFAAEFVRPQVA